jgi:hypothetical protein
VSQAGAVAATVGGVLLVVAALRDIFSTLWHPRGFGTVCRVVMTCCWRVGKLDRRERRTELAGPCGMVLTIASWSVMVVGGFALIYWPQLPEGFYFSSPLQPATSADLGNAAYLSVVAVGTLGLGDVMPADGWMRLLVPVEALIGFVLLTAAVSWGLQVYPALSRRRGLALQLSSDRRQDLVALVGEQAGEQSSGFVAEHLATLSSGLGGVHVDLLQYAETYYFREHDPELSLAATLPVAVQLADAAACSPSAQVRHAGGLLQDAVSGLCRSLDQRFLGLGDDAAAVGGYEQRVLRAFARDHQQPLQEP